MKHFLLYVIVLSFSEKALAQTTTVYYFNKDMNIVSPAKAVFTGMGIMDEDSLYKLNCYNKTTNVLVFIAHFADSTFHVFQGPFKSYHINGRPETEGIFAEGKEIGLWKKWDISGNITDSLIYDHGKIIMRKFTNYFPDGRIQAIVYKDIQSEYFRRIFYDGKGNILVSDTSREDEDEDKVFTRVEIEPTFPGGPAEWTRYIQSQIEKRIGDFNEKDYGTCEVKFIVGKDGKLLEVQALTMKGSSLADIV